MPADCAIDDCQVLAVGRCTRCRQAFCTTHQAYVDNPGAPNHLSRFVDLCAPCQVAGVESAKEAKKQERLAYEIAEVEGRQELRALLYALNTNRVEQTERWGNDGESVFELPPVWPVGALTFTVVEFGRWGDSDRDVQLKVEAGITGTGQCVAIAPVVGKPMPAPRLPLSGELAQVNGQLRQIADRAGVSVPTEPVDDIASPAFNPRRASLPRGYAKRLGRIEQLRGEFRRETTQVQNIWGKDWETTPPSIRKLVRPWKKARNKALQLRDEHDRLVAESARDEENAIARAQR